MASVTRFKDLEVGQKARILSKEIYSITQNGDFKTGFGLRNRKWISSGYIMDNSLPTGRQVDERFERGGKKEFLPFLSIVKASAGEVRSQLYSIVNQNYISTEKFNKLYDLSDQTSKMISGLMKYLKKSDFKGTKHN